LGALEILFGLPNLDKIVSREKVIHIYGDLGSGKTTLALQASINAVLTHRGKKVVYVDCAGRFDPRRLKIMNKEHFSYVARKIVMLSPKNYKEQIEIVDYIPFLAKKSSLIIFDDFTHFIWERCVIEKNNPMPYFLELNRELGFFRFFSDKLGVKIIITNMITSFDRKLPLFHNLINFWTDLDIGVFRVFGNSELREFLISPIGVRIRAILTERGFKELSSMD